MRLKENQIEQRLIDKLTDLKYTYRSDICDRETLEQNLRACAMKSSALILRDLPVVRSL